MERLRAISMGYSLAPWGVTQSHALQTFPRCGTIGPPSVRLFLRLLFISDV